MSRIVSKRSVVEGELLPAQGIDEEIAYSLDVSNNGSSPTGVSVIVYSESSSNPKTYSDVTSTVMPTGSPSVSGDVITLPPLKALTEGVIYRVEVKYTVAGQVLEDYFRVPAEK